MKAKLINDTPKTYVLVLETGDEAVNCIEGFARNNAISVAQLTAIGAFSDVVLGFFDWETKEYRKIPLQEQVEVVSFLGPTFPPFRFWWPENGGIPPFCKAPAKLWC
jgi:uncharacterized protein